MRKKGSHSPRPPRFIRDGYKKDAFTLSEAAKKEDDPEWKQWFSEIERRRYALHDPKKKKLVFSTADKENKTEKIIRKQTDPASLAAFLAHSPASTKKKITALQESYQEVQRLWDSVVGAEIAAASRLYSFKNGVVVMTIASSTLLQELRQFHLEAITADLRGIWTLPTPLATIKLKIGD